MGGVKISLHVSTVFRAPCIVHVLIPTITQTLLPAVLLHGYLLVLPRRAVHADRACHIKDARLSEVDD